MSDFEIRNDVPPPAWTSARGRRQLPETAALKKLKVGESIFFPGENTRSQFYVTIKCASFRWKWKIASRTEEDGLRIWRLE